jgi:mannitol/fructose-specific phosphotransferase system IIA component (Ntr-type)
MQLSDFIVRETISPVLQATSKEGVIRELVDGLSRAGCYPGTSAEEIVKAVLRREMLGSTGTGRGVAIPHAKHVTLTRLFATVALSQPGVPFDALDGEPVHVFVLLTSPQGEPGPHLRALELISRRLREDSFVSCLREAPTREVMWSLLCEAEVLPAPRPPATAGR